MPSHNTILFPQQIFLKSNDAKLNNDTYKSSVSFELKNTIEIPNNVDAYIQLNSFKFINSFYNVNETNNIFYYSLGDILEIVTIYELNIPIGNYSVAGLLTFLNTELNGYFIFTYNKLTFKITVETTTVSILRTGSNNCLKIFGFNNIDTELDITHTSTNLVNLAGIQVLYISIGNLIISSNTSKNSSVVNILDSINIEVLGGTSQNHINNSNSKYKIIDDSVSRIDINIYDENGLLINFNNTDWYLNMSFIFVYKMNYIAPNSYLNLQPEIVQPNNDNEIITNNDNIVEENI